MFSSQGKLKFVKGKQCASKPAVSILLLNGVIVAVGCVTCAPFLLYCPGSRSGRFSGPCDITNHSRDVSPPSHRIGNCHAMSEREEDGKKVIDTEELRVLCFHVG